MVPFGVLVVIDAFDEQQVPRLCAPGDAPLVVLADMLLEAFEEARDPLLADEGSFAHEIVILHVVAEQIQHSLDVLALPGGDERFDGGALAACLGLLFFGHCWLLGPVLRARGRLVSYGDGSFMSCRSGEAIVSFITRPIKHIPLRRFE